MTPTQMREGRAGGVGSLIDYSDDPKNPIIKEDHTEPAITLQQWRIFKESDSAYVCRVLLCPEEEGGYSAFALRLPGTVSQGDTEQEALANIAEAFQATVSLYLEEGQGIPWEPVEVERPRGCLERWILVDV